MSFDHSTTLRYSGEMQQAIEEIVEGSKHVEDVPELSQSETLRRLLDVGLDHADDLGDLVTEETRILLARQQFKDREAKVRNLRTGFETRVKRNFKRRFENGYKPEQLRDFAANMRQEARILWPDYLIDSVDDERAQKMRQRRRACIDYVDRVVEAAVEAVEDSDYDPLDPDEIFDGFEGVERGRDQQAVEGRLDDIEQEAREMARRASSPEPDDLARALMKQHGVGRSVAQQAADDAVAAVSGGASADD
jgi:hypothetical protein